MQTRYMSMIISSEIMELANTFFARTVENNEVMMVKWTFPHGELPDLSLERAERDALYADETERRATQLLAAANNHTDEMILKILIRYCSYIRNNRYNYWQRFDLNSSYRTIPTLVEKMLALPIDTPEERGLYRQVLDNFAPFVRLLHEKLVEQARRYIRMPKRSCDLVLQSLSASAVAVARSADRFGGCERPARALLAEIHALKEEISGEYRTLAPTILGMGQYPGGAEMYQREIETYISCSETPETIMARGYEELARTEAEMLEVARSMGYSGSLRAIMDDIQADPRYRFDTPDEMQRALEGHLEKIRPLMPRYFARMPSADCTVARTSEADEQTSSWGYYNVPVPGENDKGVYYYSAAELDKRCQIRTCAVVYHELLPGHHYQMNLVQEDETLPDIVHHHYDTAYADGWAEYASNFCHELGLYEPMEYFGRLSWDAFLCCRLIVDTGLNALGWTYEQARDFLLEHTMFTELEIRTELVRYTCGMPAQALAYKWGSRFFCDLRERTERALGSNFDIARFHDAVLAFGAIPLDILDDHIHWFQGQELMRAGKR